jgi:hypothetical protein
MRKQIKYVVIICAICLTTISVFSQHSIFLGAKGGISIPNLTSGAGNQNPLSNGYSSRLGADFGIFNEFPITHWLSVQTELDYSAQGGKHNGLQAIPNPFGSMPQYLYANFKNAAKLNYLLVPITARFNFSLTQKLQLYVNAGMFAGFLLTAKTVSSGSSYVYADAAGQQPVSPSAESFDNTQDIKSSVHTVNVGFIGALGLSCAVAGGKIFVEGGGNYGFINIQKYAEDGKNYTGAATIHIGYAYALICKKKH